MKIVTMESGKVNGPVTERTTEGGQEKLTQIVDYRNIGPFDLQFRSTIKTQIDTCSV